MSVAILHLRASNFVGGPERQIFSYATAVPKEEITTWIGTFTHGHEGHEFAETARSKGIPVWECSHRDIRSCVRALKLFIRERQIAMVCTHGYKATLIALLACRPKRIPVVPFLRGWTGEDLKVKTYEALERHALRWCDRVVCLSQTQATEINKQSAALGSKVRVVNNAQLRSFAGNRDQARGLLEQRFGITDSELCVVSAGRLSPEKRPFTFLEVAREIAEQEPKARFIMFGDGPLRPEVEQRAKSLGLAQRITIAGLVKDFDSLLPGTDLLINASDREQMPNVLLEAMTANVPIVATRVGAVEELLGECGILARSGDVDALVSGAVKLLKDPARRAISAKAAKERVRSHFSPLRQHQQLRDLYSDVLPFVRFDRKPLTSYPTISIVLPVRNEERRIGRVVGQLAQQDYPQDRFEILVADGRSTDDTRRIIAEIASRSAVRIATVDNPRLLSSGGRNAGAQRSTGEIVIFVDGHCFIPGRHLLYDTARVMQEQNADALARPQPLRDPFNDSFQDLVATLRESFLGHGRDSTIYSMSYRGQVDPTSSGAAYKRSVFDEIGYYDEQFDACEDVELNHRVKMAGKKCVIDPTLTVFYVPRKDVRGLFKQMLRYGRGRAALQKKHPETRSLSQMVPPVILLSIVTAFTLAWTRSWVGWGAAIPFLGYLTVCLAFSWQFARRHGPAAPFAGIFLLMTVHFGLGLGWILGSFSSGPHVNARPVRPVPKGADA